MVLIIVLQTSGMVLTMRERGRSVTPDMRRSRIAGRASHKDDVTMRNTNTDSEIE